jgi:hypothetical protein
MSLTGGGFNKVVSGTTNLALGTVNTGLEVANKGVETVGVVANKGVETVGVVANAGLDATGKIAISGFGTTADVVEHAGKITTSGLKATAGVVEHAGTAAVAGVNTVASIVSIVRDLTIRTEEISKNAALRQQEVEKLKNSELQKQVDVGMVKNTEETQKDIETIKTEAENAKLKIQKDAENERQKLILDADNKKRQIEATDEQEKIKQQLQHQLQTEELQTNSHNYKESLVYGFKNDKSPYIAGSKKITNFLNMFNTSKKIQYFGYYIIIGILNKETVAFFELHPEDLSDKQPNDIKREPNTLVYKDTYGNKVRVVLRQNYIKGFFSNRIETTLDVYDIDRNELKITGVPVFQKKSYFRDIVSQGGKSRRKNKKHKKINSRKKRQSKTSKK